MKKNINIPKYSDKASYARMLCILITSLTLVFFFIVGCLFWLRPKISESEKRELTKFPKFTLDGFLSGEWTSEVSLWFSDTYPMREGMIEANNKMNSLYGVQDDVYAEGGGVADDIGVGGMGELPDEIILDGNAGAGGESIGGFYCVGDTAYELYYFSQSNSKAYAQIVNKAAEKLKGKVNVYDMIVPLAYEFALGDDIKSSLGASDCSDAISYMYSGLSSDVKSVDICKNMAKHKDEYLYFRTDHHWTALGAYYAYEAFCQVKGITPTPLSSYQKLEFEGFLGTLYDKTKNDKLGKNPDVVEAYVPMGTNSITVVDRKGKTNTYSIVNKATDTYYSNPSSKYGCFIAGDNPISTIHNENITDGSTIIVVKESFGNAFIPFLVDSYEYVYVVDYRYFGENLCDFAIEKNADDILFINNVIATSETKRLSEMKSIVE